jgi:hypothetical protein
MCDGGVTPTSSTQSGAGSSTCIPLARHSVYVVESRSMTICANRDERRIER